MDTPPSQHLSEHTQRISATICLLLAAWLSMNNGIPYAASLAQATIFFQYTAIRIALLIQKW